MKIYVLSHWDATGEGHMTDGVWSAFSTMEKASMEVYRHIVALGELLLDWDFELTDYKWFTDKSTWQVEVLTLDDSAFE